MHVPYDRAPYEHVLDRAQVRILEVLNHRDVVQLDVEVLVDRFEGAADLDIVLELDGDFVVD